MVNQHPPHGFNSDFLLWFKEASEHAWSQIPEYDFSLWQSARRSGTDWDKGTKWLGGLSDFQIAGLERKFSIKFPPDFHLFLKTLHATDRPQRGACYSKSSLVPDSGPGFYNWKTETEQIAYCLQWVVEGLAFDVEYNDLWFDDWGPCPDSPQQQLKRLQEIVSEAPPLIPITGHRFLVGEPFKEGNPVLSIWQSDIIIFSNNLRSFLLGELGLLTAKISKSKTKEKRKRKSNAGQFGAEIYYVTDWSKNDQAEPEEIPFWERFL